MGQYFDNSDLTGWTFNRVDAVVDFDWGSGSPGGGVGSDTFSVRWTGQVVPQYSETYTFYTQSDDGVRLWVNGQLLIDNWTNHSSTEDSAAIALTAGTPYDVRLEYYDHTFSALIRLSWSSASQPKQVIPNGRLLPNGRIAFQTARDGNDEIYSMNADGGGVTNLTNHSAADQGAAAALGTGKLVWFTRPTANSPVSGGRPTWNCANGGIGNNWSGIPAGYSIVNNQLDVGTGGDIFWNPTAFGAEQGAFVTTSSLHPVAVQL